MANVAIHLFVANKVCYVSHNMQNSAWLPPVVNCIINFVRLDCPLVEKQVNNSLGIRSYVRSLALTL